MINHTMRTIIMTCTLAQAQHSGHHFKVSFAVTKTQNAYTVQYTSNVYRIDPEGPVADMFTLATPTETLLEAMH